MKKIFAICCLFVVGMFMLTGCDSQDLEGHDLVGIWVWEGDFSWRWIFNDDGTGQRGIVGQRENFTWSARGDNGFRVNVQGYRAENWTFSFDGYLLTIDRRSPAENFSYYRLGAPEGHPILGTWAWDEYSYWQYEFNDQGRGIRGEPGNTENFNFMLGEDNHILFFGGFLGQDYYQSWTFTIRGNTLDMVNRYDRRASFSYDRVD